ncbi:hypothetical protein KPATCC21470_0469 [Kitasatospora purpeofusca]
MPHRRVPSAERRAPSAACRVRSGTGAGARRLPELASRG